MTQQTEKPKQMTLDLDAGEPFKEDVRIHDVALVYSKGDFAKAIAWVERAAARLDYEHEQARAAWTRKRADFMARGHDPETFNAPLPTKPKAKQKTLANAKALLQQSASVGLA